MPVRNPHTLIIGAALLVAASAAAAPPAPAKGPAQGAAQAPAKQAKPGPKPPAAPKSKLDLPALQKSLESGDVPSMLEAIEKIGQSQDPAGAPLLEAVLGRGADAAVLGRAIETLGLLAQPSSGAALAPYVAHRTPELRRAALRALIATKSPLAGDVLRRALRGNDASLRAIAARGLGQLEVRAAVPELFNVLPKDVNEAAEALGRLCVGAECERFAGLLGKLRFEVMESGIVPILLRPQADVPDELKLKLVERLRRMATAPANQLLQTALAQFPADGSPKVKRGIERALKGFSATEATE
jgi:HEAT repeats